MRLVSPTDTAAAKAIVDRDIKEAEEEMTGSKGSYIITGDRLMWKKMIILSF